MADISKIRVDNVSYNIKDETARTTAEAAEAAVADLGALAYKDSASGSYTPAGTVTKPNVDLTSTIKTVKSCTNKGTLPSWSASVTDETLSFSWSAGTLPTTADVSINDVTEAALAAAPAFTGTDANITVS